jgi:hypothetical protein
MNALECLKKYRHRSGTLNRSHLSPLNSSLTQNDNEQNKNSSDKISLKNKFNTNLRLLIIKNHKKSLTRKPNTPIPIKTPTNSCGSNQISKENIINVIKCNLPRKKSGSIIRRPTNSRRKVINSTQTDLSDEELQK